jgi:hypothetical protein
MDDDFNTAGALRRDLQGRARRLRRDGAPAGSIARRSTALSPPCAGSAMSSGSSAASRGVWFARLRAPRAVGARRRRRGGLGRGRSRSEPRPARPGISPRPTGSARNCSGAASPSRTGPGARRGGSRKGDRPRPLRGPPRRGGAALRLRPVLALPRRGRGRAPARDRNAGALPRLKVRRVDARVLDRMAGGASPGVVADVGARDAGSRRVLAGLGPRPMPSSSFSTACRTAQPRRGGPQRRPDRSRGGPRSQTDPPG